MMSPGQMALARAWLWCTLFGHREPVVIMFKGTMVRVCPRCGEER